MRTREAALACCLGWSMAAAAATVVIERNNGDATANLREPADVAFLAFMLAPAVAGALTLRRARASVAGWLLVAATTAGATGLLLHGIAVATARGGAEPPWLIWPPIWLIGPSIALLCLVPARLFDGWARRLEPLAIAAIVAVGLAQAFGPDPLTGVGTRIHPIENPAAIDGVGPAAGVILDVAPLVLIAYGALGLLTFVREGFHRRLDVPEQLPWLLMAAALLPAIALGALVGGVTGLGAFATAWWVGVLVPLVILAATSTVVGRGWLKVRRESEQLRHVARARDEERERVRRDLHDGIGPALAGMRLQLELLRDGLAADAHEAHDAAARLERSLDETLGELRRIVDGMQPAALETVGFEGALELLRASLTPTWSQGRTTVEVEVDQALPDLPRPVQAALLRVCAEALSNAVRHADPTRCQVIVGWADGAARLRVVDDGTGIEYAAANSGVGLRSMRARIEEIGGTLEVGRPDSGTGTAITAVVPVRAW